MAQVIDDASQAEAERLEAERAAIAERHKKREEFENSKLNWRQRVAAIADRTREEKDAEFFGSEVRTIVPDPEPEVIDDEDREETSQAAASSQEARQEEDQASVANDDADEEETDGSLLVTKTINGKRITRTVDEWLAIATKVENADLYYQEAVRKQHRHEPEPVIDDTEVLREAAKKIQLGSEDEAVDGVTTLIKKAVDTANRTKREEDQQAAGRIVFETFSRDYSDVTSDPVLNAAMLQLDAQLIAEGKMFDADPVLNFDKRLRYVGNQVRNWKKGVADVSVKQETRRRLVDKKAKISNLNTANQKQSTPAERVLSEREGRDVAVQNMFASRKKKAF